jgi:hypothetical protein
MTHAIIYLLLTSTNISTRTFSGLTEQSSMTHTRSRALRKVCAYLDTSQNFACYVITDKSHLCKFHMRSTLGLEVRPSQIVNGGLGLFVAKGHIFKRGDNICIYEGIRVQIRKGNRNYGGDYVLQLSDQTVIDAMETTSCAGRYANCCREKDLPLANNAQLELNTATRVAWLVATRLIKAGSEVFAAYGDEFFV